jgi:hypothetical protein
MKSARQSELARVPGLACLHINTPLEDFKVKIYFEIPLRDKLNPQNFIVDKNFR